MLNHKDFLEATQRFKNKKGNPHHRQRYHALLLVSKGYSYREQDSDATIRWFEMIMDESRQGEIVLWIDQAPHHTSDEVEQWLKDHPRPRIIQFPAYTPEENPKEGTWKTLKEEVSHHHWHETFADLSKAINGFYQTGRRYTVNFLEKFGYCWREGRIHALAQAS